MFDRNVTKRRQGAAHGFICATQNEMDQCRQYDETTTEIAQTSTVTIAKTTTGSSLKTTHLTTSTTGTSGGMLFLLNSVFALFVLL